jgi:hypothetical protein
VLIGFLALFGLTVSAPEGLDETLWEVVFNSWADEHEIGSVLAVTAPQYAEHIERRLAATAQLDTDVLDEEPYER